MQKCKPSELISVLISMAAAADCIAYG